MPTRTGLSERVGVRVRAHPGGPRCHRRQTPATLHVAGGSRPAPRPAALALSRQACPSSLRWPPASARAFGAPVEVDVRTVKPGELRTVEWRGRPVWVLRRNADMLAALRSHDGLLSDPRSTRQGQQPDYARNDLRSVKPDIAVLVAICTHLGCVPTFRPEPGAPDIGAAWPGGFFAPATDRSSISQAASSRTCPRPAISKCRRITTPATRACASARARWPDRGGAR